MRVVYYMSTILRDNVEFINQCDKCQRFSNLTITPAEILHWIISPWPFYQWGVDILEPFHMTPSHLKYLLVGMEYFTKWVELKVVEKLMVDKV